MLAPDGIYGIDSAAFAIGTIAGWHDSPLDQAYFYGCNIHSVRGYFGQNRSPNKVYYAMKLLGDLMRDYKKRVNAFSDEPTVKILGSVVDDGSHGRLLVVSYKSDAMEVAIDCKSTTAYKFRATVLDHTHDLAPASVKVADGKVGLKKNQPGSAVFAVEFAKA